MRVIKQIVIVCLMIMIIASCSSSKMADKVVVDFIKNEIAKKYDTIFLLNQQLPSERVIKAYESAYKQRNELGSRSIYPTPTSPNWPLNVNAIQELKRIYEGAQPSPWNEKDFNFDVAIIHPDYFKYKVTPLNNNKSLYLSKPVVNKKRDVILFEYSVSRTGLGAAPSDAAIIVMVKRNGKWEKEISLWEELYN